MMVITYKIRLLEPVLVTSLAGDPNSSVSYPYIPGSVLRGMVISKYTHNHASSNRSIDASDPTVRGLFFSASVRYLNGYPMDRLGNRALPTPLSWQQNKNDAALQTPHRPASIIDFAVAGRVQSEDDWKGIGGDVFCVPQAGQVRLVPVRRRLSVHTQRDRTYGRSRKDSGAIYRYEAIAAGQMFVAMILLDDDQIYQKETLISCLKGEAELGGSRNGGYGRIILEDAQTEDRTLREVVDNFPRLEAGEQVFTLLSDTLIRNANGQFVTDANSFMRAIESQMNMPPGTLELTGKSFIGRTLLGGFNRKWGLPLVQTAALKLGSVIGLKSVAWDTAKLEKLEWLGIGERRAEGFGRFIVHWNTEEELFIEPPVDNDPPEPLEISPETSAAKLARQMATRLLRRQLDAELMRLANELGEQVRGVKRSQLSRLRMLLRDILLEEPDKEHRLDARVRIKKYLDTLKKRKTTRVQFTTAQVYSKSLLAWIEERVEDETEIWTLLADKDTRKLPIASIGSVKYAPPSVQPDGGNSDELIRLAFEYNLRLAEAVLHRASKFNQSPRIKGDAK